MFPPALFTLFVEAIPNDVAMVSWFVIEIELG